MNQHKVIIIGAGIAGLTAAVHLAGRGLAPLVLEANPQYVGGRLAGGETVQVGEWKFRMEHGVHGFWSPYRNLQAMLARLRIRPVFVPAQEEDWLYRRDGKVRRAAIGNAIRKSWLPAPFHYLNLFLRPSFLQMLSPRDLLSLLDVWSGLLWGLGVDPLAENQPLGAMTLADLVGGWSPGVQALFVGLARSGLSAKPEEIPLSGFVAFLRFYTLLRRDAWGFTYLPTDGGRGISEPLAGQVRALGGEILLGKRVTHLTQDSMGWKIFGENGDQWDSQSLILALDPNNARTLLNRVPGLTPESQKFYFPEGRETAVVRLWFDVAPKMGAEAGIFSGEFILDNFFWLHRLQEDYIQWHRATGGSAIECHIYGPSSLLAEPDAALLTRAIADVQAAFPEVRGRRIHQVLQRNAVAHTLFGVGAADRHLGVITPWQNLYCCGDWVLHPSPAFFLERACVTGMAAANAVLAHHALPEWQMLPHLPPEAPAAWIERWMYKGRLRRKQRKSNVPKVG